MNTHTNTHKVNIDVLYGRLSYFTIEFDVTKKRNIALFTATTSTPLLSQVTAKNEA